MHQTGKGRMHVMSWRDPPRPRLEPDARNAPVRNLRGGAGNGTSGTVLMGYQNLIRSPEETALALYSTI